MNKMKDYSISTHFVAQFRMVEFDTASLTKSCSRIESVCV